VKEQGDGYLFYTNRGKMQPGAGAARADPAASGSGALLQSRGLTPKGSDPFLRPKTAAGRLSGYLAL